MQFALQVHGESLVCVAGGLERATDFTHLHILVLLLNCVVDDRLELGFLLLELVHLCHDSFSLFNLAFLSKLLCIFVVEVDFCLKLIDFRVGSILLCSVHLRLIDVLVVILSALRTVLSSGETPLDLLVHLCHHLRQLHNELVLILPLVAVALPIVNKLLLQVVVMTVLAWPDVSLRVREEVVRAEGEQIELANVLVIEVVTACQSNEEWLVAVLPHELI